MGLLDIVFLALLGFSAYRGYNKGAFASLSLVAGYVIAIIGSLIFYQPLAVYLEKDVGLTGMLQPWVAEKISLPAASFETKIGEVAFGKVAEIVEQQQMPEVFKKTMLELANDVSALPVTKGINTLGEGISYILSNFLTTALSFFILYTGLSLLFRIILPRVFKTVSPSPVRLVDKIGGALVGATGGVVTIGTFILVLTPIASMGAMKGNQSPLADQMANSVIVTLFVENIRTLF